jgi:hypothetical protein
MSSATSSNGKAGAAAVPIWAHVVCGWPLVMVVFGGAIGGGLGGAAYAGGIAIWKSRLPLAAKIVLVPLIGVAAIGLWAVIASALLAKRG